MLLKSKIIFLVLVSFFYSFSLSKVVATTGQTDPVFIGYTSPTGVGSTGPRLTSCSAPNGRLSINSSACFNNVLLKCSNTALLNYTVCTYGCSDNICKDKTTPSTKINNCSTPNGLIALNSSTCFENTLYKCSSGASLLYTNCVYGCSNNTCRNKNDPKPTMCSAPYGNIALNTSACMANTIYKCSNAGTLTSTTCPYGCSSNYCNGKPAPTPTPLPTPTPTPAPTSCSAPGGSLPINGSRCFSDAIFKCSSTAALSVTNCPNGCLSDTSCKPDPTPPPSSCSLKGGYCRPDFTCMGNYYITGDYCSMFSCCAPRPIPTPTPTSCWNPAGNNYLPLNGTYCYQGGLFRCSSTGVLSVLNCPYGCSGGSCSAPPVTYCSSPVGSLPIGSSTCFDNAIFRCQSNGSLSITSCSYGCSGSSCKSQPNYCYYPGGTLSINTSTCYSGTVYQCQSNGSLYTQGCSYGCSGSSCNSQPKSCSYPGGTLSPNSSSCYSTALFSCSSSGTLNITSCPYGCSGNYCKSATY